MLEHASYEFISKHCKTMDEFFSPLKIYGIHYFSFGRIFKNGKIIFLCNQLDWLNIKIDNNLFDYPSFIPKTIENEIISDYETHIFSGSKCKYNKDPLLNLLYETNRWNSIDFFTRNHDHVDILHFASTVDNTAIIKFYTNNQRLLKFFANVFLVQFAKIFEDMLKYNLCIEFNKVNKYHYKDMNQNLFKLDFENIDYKYSENKELLKILSFFKNLIFNSNGQRISLSNRESTCMFLLAQGKTYKEIANFLELSHRTIEQYINNIKLKTGLHFKSEIIDCLYDNFGNIIF